MKATMAALALCAVAGETRAKEPGEAREGIERRMRMMRLAGLSEALALSDERALKLNHLFEPFDDRRRKVGEQMRDARQVIKRAAEGDEAAHKDLDPAVAKVLDARAQINEIDRDMYKAFAKELTPTQRAKFVVFMGEFRKGMEKMARHARHRARGPGGPGPDEP